MRALQLVFCMILAASQLVANVPSEDALGKKGEHNEDDLAQSAGNHRHEDLEKPTLYDTNREEIIEENNRHLGPNCSKKHSHNH